MPAVAHWAEDNSFIERWAYYGSRKTSFVTAQKHELVVLSKLVSELRHNARADTTRRAHKRSLCIGMMDPTAYHIIPWPSREIPRERLGLPTVYRGIPWVLVGRPTGPRENSWESPGFLQAPTGPHPWGFPGLTLGEPNIVNHCWTVEKTVHIMCSGCYCYCAPES